jgi:hypothetical protein
MLMLAVHGAIIQKQEPQDNTMSGKVTSSFILTLTAFSSCCLVELKCFLFMPHFGLIPCSDVAGYQYFGIKMEALQKGGSLPHQYMMPQQTMT